jgi:hypothetical protein
LERGRRVEIIVLERIEIKDASDIVGQHVLAKSLVERKRLEAGQRVSRKNKFLSRDSSARVGLGSSRKSERDKGDER